MKRISVKATYENGMLKLAEPLPLAEQETVSVMVFIGPSFAERSAGLLKWTGPPEDLDYLINSPEEGLWTSDDLRGAPEETHRPT